jgi:hypothetical protein
MKYLRKIFESEEKLLITKEFALDFQDIFIEIEDYSNIFIEKSYYDNDDEEWKKIEDFSELSYNQYSISFYVTKPLSSSADYSHMPKEIVIDMIECCKRIFKLSQEINHTITYREVNRHQGVTNDREISIDKIDSLIDKDIVSISITSWSF